MPARWFKPAQGGLPRRLLATFVAVVMLVAIVGPGIATYASESDATAPAEGDPAALLPAVETPAAPEVAPEAAPEAPAAPVVVASEPSVEPQLVAPPAMAVVGGGNLPLTSGGVRINAPAAGVTTYTAATVEKIEPPVPDGFWIKTTVWETSEGWWLNFESNFPISRVVMKGGDSGYLVWDFDPAVTSGTNLHCPANSNNGKFAGVSHADFYFGEESAGDLTVYKYQDDDQDMAWDNGVEDMLAGWDFTLYNDNGDVVDSGTTDADGKIVFAGLEPGDYHATETLKGGWDNTTALTQYITVTSGGEHELWFGNVPEQEETQPGDLTVYKYQDDDKDMAWDEGDEQMLANWEFSLYRGNYWDDAPDTLVGTECTDVDGEIAWAGLDPGEYYAIETLKSGWDNTTALVQHVVITSNGEHELWFGNVPETDVPELGDVIIHKFQDDDRDQVWDEGEEQLLSDWEFTITGATTPPILTGVAPAAVWMLVDQTDNNGEILVAGQSDGTLVSATETLQDGWTNTTPLTQCVEVQAGETRDLWFGNVPVPEEPKVGNLVIHKYRDDDEDQNWDEADEPLLSGWEFTVGGAIADQQIQPNGAWLVTDETDSDGEILYENLPAGMNITATETMQDGWHNTTPLTQTTQIVAGETVHLWFGNAEDFLRFTELDLAITKTVDDRTVDEGQLLTYTLTYWNTMDEEAAVDYNIVDDFDERYLTIVDSAGGTVANGKITWNFAGPLAKADGKKTITYTARVNANMPDAKTNIDNVVRIWDDKDKDPSNNQDDERVVYQPDDPFLPFTGGEYLLLIVAAMLTGVVGLTLRLKPRKSS